MRTVIDCDHPIRNTLSGSQNLRKSNWTNQRGVQRAVLSIKSLPCYHPDLPALKRILLFATQGPRICRLRPYAANVRGLGSMQPGAVGSHNHGVKSSDADGGLADTVFRLGTFNKATKYTETSGGNETRPANSSMHPRVRL